MKRINLEGIKFGKLTVLQQAEDKITPKNKKVTQWKCLCSCGNTTIVATNNLRRGHTQSCGCLNNGNNRKHNKSYSRIYHIWVNMIQRCTNINNKSFKDYGGRGITVCKEWKEFQNFDKWALNNGYSDNLTIDRIDVNENYEPSNCRWVTVKEQANNKRNNHIVTFFRETHSITEWSRILNIPLSTLARKNKDDWIQIYNEYYSSKKLSERDKRK